MPRSVHETKRRGTRSATEITVVRLEHIGKRYGDGAEVLHDLSFALELGAFRFLTGASGAGKTTLLNIICLAERPSEGSVGLFGAAADGLDRSARAALRRRIGIVFQDFRLLDELSVGENVALPLRIVGASENEIGERVPALLRWFGMEQHIGARPMSLSSSDKQRVAIARAIVTRPDLLIADEPTGSGDAGTADLLVSVCERLNRMGTTVLVATRDTAFASRFEHSRLHLEHASLGRLDTPAQ